MEVVCSAAAGICARLLCHPLDTIKTVAFTGFAGEHELMSAGVTANAKAPASEALASLPHEVPRSSFISSAKSIWAREGISGFYRDVGVAAVGSAPGVALYLTTYDRCSAAWKVFGDATPATDGVSGNHAESTVVEAVRRVAAHTPTNVRFFMCGLGAEAVSCLVWVPIDVAKERLQSQPPTLPARYASSVDALRRIMTNEGVRGLYKGYWSTLGSFGPFSAVYFVFYEYFATVLKKWAASSSSSFSGTLSKKDSNMTSRGEEQLSSAARFAIALGAGAGGNVIASLCTNPLELVKTRLQVQRAVLYRQAATIGAAAVHPKLYVYHYEGLRDGLTQMVKTEGLRALWKGIGSRIAYTAPNAALTMGLFELFKLKLM
jgi:hypothetical protein